MNHWDGFPIMRLLFLSGGQRIAKQVDAALYYVDVERVKRGILSGHFSSLDYSSSEAIERDYDLTDWYTRARSNKYRRRL